MELKILFHFVNQLEANFGLFVSEGTKLSIRTSFISLMLFIFPQIFVFILIFTNFISTFKILLTEFAFVSRWMIKLLNFVMRIRTLKIDRVQRIQ